MANLILCENEYRVCGLEPIILDTIELLFLKMRRADLETEKKKIKLEFQATQILAF